MNGLHFRPFTTADKDACLKIFMGNTPKYFGVDELPDFRTFLNTLPCPYFVVTRNEEVIACGGYGMNGKKQAMILAWGMARIDLHKQGIGAFLLVERLKQIYRESGQVEVQIETSQHSRGFFERFGFVAGEITEDFFAPGLHRVDMKLLLDADRYTRLTNQSTE